MVTVVWALASICCGATSERRFIRPAGKTMPPVTGTVPAQGLVPGPRGMTGMRLPGASRRIRAACPAPAGAMTVSGLPRTGGVASRACPAKSSCASRGLSGPAIAPSLSRTGRGTLVRSIMVIVLSWAGGQGSIPASTVDCR